MIRQNKYCPHCHACYERGSYGGRDYGSPLRVCGSCRNSFIDKNYIEPFFEETPQKITLWQAFLACLWPVGLICIGLAVMLLCVDYHKSGLLAAIPLSLYILLSFFVYLRREKLYEKQCQERKASHERLLNREYVMLLLDHDCYVSHDFLLREHPDLLHYTSKGYSIPHSKETSYLS